MENSNQKTISRAEVLKHNKLNDCWLVIRNNVYNFTPFIKQHPGGSDILMSRAGEDATSYFIGKHGNNKAIMRQLEKLRIGILPDSERILTDDFDEPFLMELIDQCRKQKLYQIPTIFKNKYTWLRFANIVVFFTLSILAIYGAFPWYIAMLLVVGQAIIGTSLFGLVAHESTHRLFPKNKILKGILKFTWPVFWPFIAQNALRYEHNSHHVKIGDPEYDFEVAGFASLIRYTGEIEPNWFHRHQHKIAKFIYPFYANIITTIGGKKSTFWSSHNRKVYWEHAYSLIITGIYFIGIPALITGQFWWFFLLYMTYQCVLFYGIYVGAAINHFVPQIVEEIPDEHKDKYAYYICHNTTNFCSDSNFWFWYTGGFNVQIEHHLIPFVPVENLRKMTPIVKALCEKYGYPYHNYSTVKHLWDAHYDYLRIMSNDAASKFSMLEMANKKSYHAR